MVTAADVALWGKFTLPEDEDLLEHLERVVSAVIEHVTEHYVVAEEMTDTQELAVILQASRLWRRRETPEGLAAFADLAVVRVQSLDRDVEMLLTPKFGFA